MVDIVNRIVPAPDQFDATISGPSLSVVIPAHNEENVIARCLESLLADTATGEIEVIVAANGCTDRTVTIARAFEPHVRVIEIAEASKSAALNAGDAAATAFPRAYLDADINVGISTLRAVVTAMARTGALVGAPRPSLDFEGCSWAVRSFFKVWVALPWFTDRPVGSGLYVLSAAGHARLGRFPDITNDDQYVHDLFAFEERLTLDEHRFTVRPARTVAALLRRRTRTLAGQMEIERMFGALPGRAPRLSLLRLLARRPDLAIHMPAFAVITLLAKRAARSKQQRRDRSWERDETSRGVGPGSER